MAAGPAGRGLPRHAGHKEGVEPVRMCIRESMQRQHRRAHAVRVQQRELGSSQRGSRRLDGLVRRSAGQRAAMNCTAMACACEFIGERQNFPVRLQTRMQRPRRAPPPTPRCELQIAVGYGGRWDIVNAARQLAARCVSGALRPADIDEPKLWGRPCSWPACLIRICSSALAASSASAISCCGTSPIPSCISAMHCGPISTRQGSRRRWSSSPRASVAMA